MKIFTIIAAFFLMCTASARADITWTFNDVTFCLHCGMPTETDNDITSPSWFTTDNGASTVTGYDITVEGTNTGANNEYKMGDGGGFQFPDANHVDFFSFEYVQYLDFFLASPGITSAGGTVNLLLGDAGADSNSTIACNGCSVLVSGSITGSTGATVPEPRFGALAVFGLAALGFMGLRKFARA
jgi:hypothetical protein